MNLSIPSPLEKIETPLLEVVKRDFYIKRDDLIHPLVSGNKWRKLQGYIEGIDLSIYSGIATCGGPWSNHIPATAVACSAHHIKSVGIVRGNHYKTVNPMLKLAQNKGMELIFLSNSEFSRLQSHPEESLEKLQLDHWFYIPMGGSGAKGEIGCGSIIDEINHQITGEFTLCIAAGTGTTASGILARANTTTEMYVQPAVNSSDTINKLLNLPDIKTTDATCTLLPLHRKGFGRIDSQLVAFLRQFYIETGILMDPLYNGKLLETIYNRAWLEKSDIPVVLYHSGGTAGWTGFIERYENEFDLEFVKNELPPAI